MFVTLVRGGTPAQHPTNQDLRYSCAVRKGAMNEELHMRVRSPDPAARVGHGGTVPSCLEPPVGSSTTNLAAPSATRH